MVSLAVLLIVEMNSGYFESLVYMIYQLCEFEVEEKTASRIISRFLSSIFA